MIPSASEPVLNVTSIILVYNKKTTGNLHKKEKVICRYVIKHIINDINNYFLATNMILSCDQKFVSNSSMNFLDFLGNKGNKAL